jgi:hypothetical protein
VREAALTLRGSAMRAQNPPRQNRAKRVGEIQLGVGEVPRQKVADALFTPVL